MQHLHVFPLRGKCLVPCQTASLAPQFLVNERTALSNRSTQATECTYRRERDGGIVVHSAATGFRTATAFSIVC